MSEKPFVSVSSRSEQVLEEHAKYVMEKIFHTHCDQGRIAYDSNGNTRSLSECNFNEVRFIGGEWRIQNKFEHEIQVVRGRKFVLGEKINRTEKNLFEFYRARMVGRNCYGYYMFDTGTEIVAKYETDDETFWAYGNTIEQARAFLAISVYDKYRDVIHAAACKSKTQKK